MAFAAGTIWHGWSSGATNFGGGFDPTNANFLTDLTTDANTANTSSPVVSSASYNFVAGDVGAWLFIQSGTNWTPGWYQIASVASNKATLTASIGSGVLYGTSTTGLNYHRPNGATTVAGCATVGTPTGGVWSIDYSQQTAAQFSYTDIVIDGTTNTDATSAANPFGKQQLGNIINIASGTGFTVQRVQLTSIPSGVVGRFDKSLGTLSSTGGTGKMGGAIGSTSVITALTQSLVAGNKIFLKGTFTLTVTTTVTAATKGDTTTGRISVEGFATIPGARDGRPVITSATNSVALLTLNDNDYWEFVHLKFTHTAATRGNAVTLASTISSPLSFIDCVFGASSSDGCLRAFNAGGISSLVTFDACEICFCTDATAAISITLGINVFGCDIHDNTGDGIRNSNNPGAMNLQDSIFDTNVVGFNDVASSNNVTIVAHGCLFIDNTSDGIKVAAKAAATLTLELSNNIFANNGGWAVNNLDTQAETDANVRMNRKNFFYSNSSGTYSGMTAGYGDVALSGDPFPNRASRDFTPAAGVGLRGVAFPAAFPSGTTSSYRDGGPVQHQDSGGSGIKAPLIGPGQLVRN